MNLTEKLIRFNRSNRVLSHTCFWIAALLVSTAADSYQQESWFSANRFMYHTLTLITQILSAYYLAYFIIPQFAKAKQHLQVLVYFVLGMYLICGFARTINIHVYEPLSAIPPKAFETMTEIFTNVQRLFYVYFFRNLSVAIVFLFLKLLVDQYDIQKRAITLEKEKSETELKMLKTQLNPHFLFNTLNNIYSLSLINSPATSASIAGLADILDHILYRCNALLVPLSAEITLLNNYISLEKLRYDERLKVNFKTSISHQIDIAPLILLSLTENAFKHGASADTGKPLVCIDLQVTDDVFTFRITNSVVSTPGQKNEDELPKRIGLMNLKQQLQLVYGNNFTLETSTDGRLFTVNLTIALEPKVTA